MSHLGVEEGRRWGLTAAQAPRSVQPPAALRPQDLACPWVPIWVKIPSMFRALRSRRLAFVALAAFLLAQPAVGCAALCLFQVHDAGAHAMPDMDQGAGRWRTSHATPASRAPSSALRSSCSHPWPRPARPLSRPSPSNGSSPLALSPRSRDWCPALSSRPLRVSSSPNTTRAGLRRLTGIPSASRVAQGAPRPGLRPRETTTCGD